MPLYADEVIIDPPEAPQVPARVPLDLSEMGLGVLEARWGESSIEGTAIQTSMGQMLVDRRDKPTSIELTLAVREDQEVDLPTAAYRLQQKLGTIQRGGTWIKRVPKVGGPFAGPILYRITGVISLGDIAGWGRGEQPDVKLTLERDPTGYALDELKDDPVAVASERHLITAPAQTSGTDQGLETWYIENQGKGSWRGLIFASECRGYSDAPTAELAYEAVDLTPRGGAFVEEGRVKHNSLTASWLPILGSEIAGLGHMTHREDRRMLASVEVSEAEEPRDMQLHLIWRTVGAAHWVDTNPIVSPPGPAAEYLVDLGECRPQPAPFGEEAWEWMLLARSLSPEESDRIEVRSVYVLPTQLVKLSLPAQPARPENEAIGIAAAATNSAGIGTVDWKEPSNATGSFDSSWAEAALSSAGPKSHHLKLTNFGFSIPSGARITGIHARVRRNGTQEPRDLAVRLVKGGAVQSGDRSSADPWGPIEVKNYGGAEDLWDGEWTPANINSSGFGFAIAVERSPLGGEPIALVDTVSLAVYYADEEEDDVVCFPGRELRITSSGVYRQAKASDVWGPLIPDGFYPTATPSGLEEQPTRAIVIPTESDLDSPDQGLKSFSAQRGVRPGYHFAREPAA